MARFMHVWNLEVDDPFCVWFWNDHASFNWTWCMLKYNKFLLIKLFETKSNEYVIVQW